MMAMDSHILRRMHVVIVVLPPPPTKASLNTSKNNSWHLGGLGMPGRSYQRLQQALEYEGIAPLQPDACDRCQVYVVRHKTTPLWA